jgi:FkbM family methyltransferase
VQKAIQKLANLFGYRICRLSKPAAAETALAAMQRLLADVKEPIIFDVGAYDGRVSNTFRNLFPDSIVYAFEPFKESFDLLKANTSMDKRIYPFNFGISNMEETRAFYSNAHSGTNSLLQTDESGPITWGMGYLETREVLQAQLRTIDFVMETMGIPRIDLLKLDVQGTEPLVIEGASETCRKGKVNLVFSEVIIQPTYKGQKRFDEALASFYDRGLDLYNIYNMDFNPEGRLRQIDVIFTKRPDNRD